MSGKAIIIDGRDHLVGRLASIIAKKLLTGRKIVVVRCEQLVYSGARFRQQRRAIQRKAKRTLTNPKKGPFHERAPSRVFQRVVRGMLPHRTPRGAAALGRLKLFDGCPAPYDTRKKLVVPAALRPLRLAAQRAYCSLGEVQENVGWKYRAVVRRLEDARKLKAYKWHLQQKAARKNEKLARRAAAKDPKLAPFSALLKQYGA